MNFYSKRSVAEAIARDVVEFVNERSDLNWDTYTTERRDALADLIEPHLEAAFAARRSIKHPTGASR